MQVNTIEKSISTGITKPMACLPVILAGMTGERVAKRNAEIKREVDQFYPADNLPLPVS